MLIVKSEKMKIFQILRQKFAILGICPIESEQAIDRRNKCLIGFLVFGVSIISHCVFLFVVANTFEEYANSIYMTTITISLSAVYTIIICKTKNLFYFIEGCEQTIVESK